MTKVTVHSYTWYDIQNDRLVEQMFKRTAEDIASKRELTIIPDTAEEVDVRDLDDDGRYEKFDYDEVVRVMDNGETPDPLPDVMRGGPSPPMRLAKAVRTVVVDWSGFRQSAAMILRDGAPAISKLSAIRAIYDRPDFPREADALDIDAQAKRRLMDE